MINNVSKNEKKVFKSIQPEIQEIFDDHSGKKCLEVKVEVDFVCVDAIQGKTKLSLTFLVNMRACLTLICQETCIVTAKKVEYHLYAL